MDREILAKAAAWFARETEMLPEVSFIKAHQAFYPVRRMCGLLTCLPQRLLRLAQAVRLQEGQRGRYAT